MTLNNNFTMYCRVTYVIHGHIYTYKYYMQLHYLLPPF
jgi:hypothetical protein